MGKSTTASGLVASQRGIWTERQARDVLAELRSTGESATSFARRKGVSRQRVAYWVHRLAEVSPPRKEQTAGTKFVAVPLPPAVAAPSSAWIEIAVDGAVVRVREGLDAEHVARLVDAIARRVRRPC